MVSCFLIPLGAGAGAGTTAVQLMVQNRRGNKTGSTLTKEREVLLSMWIHAKWNRLYFNPRMTPHETNEFPAVVRRIMMQFIHMFYFLHKVVQRQIKSLEEDAIIKQSIS